MRGIGVLQLWAWITVLVMEAMPAAAQETPAESYRLTVRPREMATATRTEQAGDFPLDSLEDYLVHVPQPCVGARRCPLLVVVPGAGQKAGFAMKWQRIMSDKHGLIVLVLDGSEPPEGTKIDAAMKQVLRMFAIDPDKIALLGRCAGGWASNVFGGKNFDIFSRILSVSGGHPSPADMDPPNKKTEIFLDNGLLESAGEVFRGARALREAGYRVKLVATIRHHGENVDDYDFIGRWLQESWAIPDPATRPAPRVIESMPVLTTEALTKMTGFWERFMQEPDSILMTGRRAHQREVIVPVGEERPTVPMMDMPAMAAQYSSVAAALQTAGLTAAQHDAYRVALLSVLLAKQVQDAATAEGVEANAGVISPTSVLAQNIAFMEAHPDEFEALQRAGVRDLQLLDGIGMDLPVDSSTRDAEAQARTHTLGIWRTP